MMRDDWVEVELGEVCSIARGGSPRPIKKFITSENDGINWIKIGDTKDVSKYIRTVAEKIKHEGLSKTRLVKAGDLLLSNSMSFGRPYILEISGAIHDGWLVLSNREGFKLYTDYMYYVLSSPDVFGQFSRMATGSTVKNLNTGLVSKVIVKIPPLPEQRAIVAKIEKLLSDLDNGIANFKTAKAKLEIFRQAVLKKAFEGELTKEWRKNSRDMQNTWRFVKLREVCEKVQDGSHFSPKKKFHIKSENLYPYVTSKNIRNNYMDMDNVEYVDHDFHESIYSRCDPKFGDVLLTKDGVNTGNVTLNSFNEPISLLSSVCLIRPNCKILISSYVKYYIQSPIGFKEMTGKMTGTAIKRIILKKIKDTMIPIPSKLEEQHAIVAAIESRLSVCDKMTEIIDQSLEKAEALRQSILKKAFEGKLLSDDELAACRREADWEPAQALLERIREDKAGGGKKTRAEKNRNT